MGESIPSWRCHLCELDATVVNFWGHGSAGEAWPLCDRHGWLFEEIHGHTDLPSEYRTPPLNFFRPIIRVQPGSLDHIAWEVTFCNLFRTLMQLTVHG